MSSDGKVPDAWDDDWVIKADVSRLRLERPNYSYFVAIIYAYSRSITK